ncbi:Hsp20/alpha crystallin family protein [Armatimonas sp.]|uniref:Hsp20/alpha crystallin family protein n=1 Tax=Armatimonas sp. TaxID=1872638 RepID=UPI00375348B7
MTRFTEDALRAFLDNQGGVTRFWQPAADVHETRDALVIRLELAGATTETLSVTLSGDGRHLTVAGSRGEGSGEEKTLCHQLEIYFGPFERTFELPEDFRVDRDTITATLKNGFLTIRLPERSFSAMPTRKIPISQG